MKHGLKDPKFLRERQGKMERLYGGAEIYGEIRAAEKQNRRKVKKALAKKQRLAAAREE